MRRGTMMLGAIIAAALVASACGGGTSGGATLEQGKANQLVFSPATLSVKTGATITVDNVSSSTAHTFTIEGRGINVVNQPGKSATVKIDLPAGTYRFVCTFHVSSGMKGTLTVTG